MPHLNLATLRSSPCEPVLALCLGYRTERNGALSGYEWLVGTVTGASLTGFSVGRALLSTVLLASVVPVAVPSAGFLFAVAMRAVGAAMAFVIAVVAGTALEHFRTGRTVEQRQPGAETGL